MYIICQMCNRSKVGYYQEPCGEQPSSWYAGYDHATIYPTQAKAGLALAAILYQNECSGQSLPNETIISIIKKNN